MKKTMILMLDNCCCGFVGVSFERTTTELHVLAHGKHARGEAIDEEATFPVPVNDNG